MKFFCRCFRENFTSPLTYIAAIIFAILCGFGVTVQINEETYSFFDILFNSKLLSKAVTVIECSSYIMARGFDSSEWYIIGLSVTTAIPALYTYIKSHEKIHNFVLIRLNYKTYSAGIVLSSFFSGMIITVAGIFIFIAATYLIFPTLESFANPHYQQIYGDNISDRLFPLMKKISEHAFVGGVIPVFAITLYRFIHSDFIAATTPMMLMYVSMKIFPVYNDWLSAYKERQQNVFCRILTILFPSNVTMLGSSFERILNAPFWLAYLFLGMFVYVNYLLFYRSVRKV